jgi:hypothetical protein
MWIGCDRGGIIVAPSLLVVITSFINKQLFLLNDGAALALVAIYFFLQGTLTSRCCFLACVVLTR